TTTAPQSLLFMNSPQGREYAQAFAKRLDAEQPADKIRQAFHLAFGRQPTEQELQTAGAFLEGQTQTYTEAKKENPVELALIDFCQTLMSMNEFVYVN